MNQQKLLGKRNFNAIEFILCRLSLNKKYIVTFCLVLLTITNAFPQSEGAVFISNYTPEEYRASRQIFASVQDSRGILYIANVDGVIIYDGTFWNLVKTPANSYIRALAIDRYDRVYAGAYDDFGMLETNKAGELEFKSLVSLLPKDDQAGIENIWSIQVIGESVYFQGRQALYHYRDNQVAKINYSGKINRISAVKNKLYITDEANGVFTLANDKFIPVPNGEFFAGKSIYSIFQYADQPLLFVSRRRGVYQYDLSSNEEPQELSSIPNSQVTSIVYSSHLMPEGTLVLGTWNNGLYLYPQTGNPQLIDEAKGLSHNRVISVNHLNNQNLLVGTQSGFSYVETSTPVTYWNEQNGLEGRITAMTRFKGKLYVGTESGLYYFDEKQRITKIEGDNFGDIWDLFVLPDHLGGELLIGTNGGVISYDGVNRKDVSFESCVAIAYSESFPNSVFFCSQKLVRLKKEDGLWKEKILAPLNDAWSLGIDKQKDIWVGTYTNGVCRVEAKQLTELDSIPETSINYYGVEQGLSSLSNKVVSYGEEVVVLNEEKGVYRFNAAKNQFDLHATFQQAFDTDTVLLSALSKYPSSNMTWFESESGLGYFSNENGKTQKVSYKYINRVGNPPGFDTKIYADQDDIVWVGSAKGLFRYDHLKAQNYQSTMATHIRRVVANKDSLIYGGYPVEQTYSLPYKMGNIIFNYSATNYDKSAGVLYSYYLEGNDDDWSEWTDETKKEYTNLWEGNYTFRVKAKDRYLEVTEEAVLEFEIRSPWYRTYWAILVYALVLGGLIWLMLRLNGARLRAANEKLEQVVSQRTQELKEKNEEVLLQNEELQQQQEEIITQRDYIEQQNQQLQEHNQQITDSIRYAETIQSGILPFKERLDEHLKSYFILYRPKDIVSGDFYWFENLGAVKLLALADCTGHGVPGAFMSMIGAAALNDIVLKNKVTSPAGILNELNIVIQKVLKGNNNDGMDIGICVWKTHEDGTTEMTYAGAKRPLYWISDGKLETVKGTRRSIGGGTRVQKVSFVDETITMKPNTVFYLLSDGYVDQNGEKNPKRIGTKQFTELLLAIHQKTESEQKQLLEEHLDKYQGKAKQRDDIALIGVRV